jgi:hypothetical protein
MAMTMTGNIQLHANREAVWAQLNDPAVLKSCIPGCAWASASSTARRRKLRTISSKNSEPPSQWALPAAPPRLHKPSSWGHLLLRRVFRRHLKVIAFRFHGHGLSPGYSAVAGFLLPSRCDRNKRGDTLPLALGRIRFLALIASTVAIEIACVCRKLDSAILVMKSAEDGL